MVDEDEKALPPGGSPGPRRSRRVAFAILTLCLLALIAFSRSLGAGFIELDDYLYIVNRPEIVQGLSWENLLWAFTTRDGGLWMPVTRISLQFDGSLSGASPTAYHLHNLLLHLANTGLVFLVLHGATGSLGRSLLAAALWSVHPLRVESVAWVAERKGLSSSFWGLLAVLAWVRLSGRQPRRAQLLAALCFALSAMAKVAFVVVPLLLLLLAWWPLGRIRSLRDVLSESRRLAALFAIAAAGVAIPYFALGSIGSVREPDFGGWVGAVASCYAMHLWKSLTAQDLAVYYTREAHSFGGWESAAVALLLAIATAASIRLRTRRPWLLVGWLWFLVAAAPTSGLIQAGSHAFADRYTYVPSIGLILAAVWSLPERLLARRRGLPATLAVALAVLALEVRASVIQTGYWRDSVTLFEQAASHDDGSYLVHATLASSYLRRGDLVQATRHFRRAVEIVPDYPRGYRDLARALGMRGLWRRAARELRRAVELAPSWVRARDDYAIALAKLGRFDQALAQLETALRLDPRDELVRKHRAELLTLRSAPGGDLAAPPPP
jgi:tetratricopeptide (TPR) repeat protein